MSFSQRMQRSHLYSVLLCPRGAVRLADQGAQIAQMYLSPYDRLIGVIGESGSGKSILIKGMFPGLELTNDDEGVNVRPLPLMNLDDTGFFSPHTYHVDIRFEMAFYQAHELASAIMEAVSRKKRVIVEHFDLIYPHLDMNAHLLLGLGEEIIITRPNVFGPEPDYIKDIVFLSFPTRRMAHTAEDLTEFSLIDHRVFHYEHSDVRSGFILSFHDRPNLDLRKVEEEVLSLIDEDLPISYVDDTHVMIGDQRHYCTGPRLHMKSTGGVKNFHIYPEFVVEPISGEHQMIGLVNVDSDYKLSQLNKLLSTDVSAVFREEEE